MIHGLTVFKLLYFCPNVEFWPAFDSFLHEFFLQSYLWSQEFSCRYHVQYLLICASSSFVLEKLQNYIPLIPECMPFARRIGAFSITERLREASNFCQYGPSFGKPEIWVFAVDARMNHALAHIQDARFCVTTKALTKVEYKILKNQENVKFSFLRCKAWGCLPPGVAKTCHTSYCLNAEHGTSEAIFKRWHDSWFGHTVSAFWYAVIGVGQHAIDCS